MKDPQSVIKHWTMVGLIYSILYTILAIWYLVGNERGIPLVGCGIFFVAALFWVGTISALKANYPTAKVCMMIGGILGCPLGLLMIIAGNRIVAADRGRVVWQALRFLSEDGEIDIGKLAAEVGIPAGEVREEMAEAQKSGKIPDDAKILN